MKEGDNCIEILPINEFLLCIGFTAVLNVSAYPISVQTLCQDCNVETQKLIRETVLNISIKQRVQMRQMQLETSKAFFISTGQDQGGNYKMS